MAVLHLLQGSAAGGLDACLARAVAGDTVVLMENAVYASIKGGRWAQRLAAAGPELRLFALAPDLSGRGLSPSEIVAGIELLDYTGLVELSCEYAVIQSW